jgi:hypothetical protein
MPTKSKSLDLVDAKRPYKYTISKDHLWGTFSKAKQPLSLCINERAILDDDRILDVKFDRTVVQVIFKGAPHVAQRFIPDQDGHTIAEINDKLGKKGLRRFFKERGDKPIEAWLLKPRRTRSLEYLRSDEMKAIRKKSQEKRAKERAEGDPKGDYTPPSKKGFRNGSGQGLAHMWKIRDSRHR